MANTTSTALDKAALAEHAAAIRRLGKQTVESVIEIGRHLTEAKAEIKKLGESWGDWLEAEFKWSDQQARRFMHVFERKSGLNKLLNSDFPISALYLLAAPSTPPEARDEVIKRAEAGEQVTVAEVKTAVAKRKPKPESKPKLKRGSRAAREDSADKVERETKGQESTIAALRSEIDDLKVQRGSASERARCSICHNKERALLRPVFVCDGCVDIYEIAEATSPVDDEEPAR
jgi:hypothetical protein